MREVEPQAGYMQRQARVARKPFSKRKDGNVTRSKGSKIANGAAIAAGKPRDFVLSRPDCVAPAAEV
jgi:hypothetical protein